MEITSLNNELIKELTKLNSKKYRDLTEAAEKVYIIICKLFQQPRK